MQNTLSFAFAFIILSSLISCGSPKKIEDQPIPVAKTLAPLPTTIEEAVANTNYRTAANRERDLYRHPVETLQFFGLKPEMTVVEISPGAGWYTEILAPLLAEKGKYFGTAFPKEAGEWAAKYNEKIAAFLRAHPELEPKVTLVPFAPKTNRDLVPEGTADMVVTFRNVHNWIGDNAEQAAFHSFFKALKPGGVLGVVEHRAAPKAKRDPKATSGYMRESDVIALAQKAGFKLEAKSEINANPKDPKNHPKGVWTLPPSYALGDQDKEKYAAIGESDRMTLRFVKPIKR